MRAAFGGVAGGSPGAFTSMRGSPSTVDSGFAISGRQLRQLERGPIPHHERVLEHVAKLTHVSGPGVPLERGPGIVAHARFSIV